MAEPWAVVIPLLRVPREIRGLENVARTFIGAY